jgi:hypothetical protein
LQPDTKEQNCPERLHDLLAAGGVKNIDAAVRELVKLGCNVRMRDNQVVPMYFPGDHNSLNMIISLTLSNKKKHKSYATTGAAFGLLRILLKNITRRPRTKIDLRNVVKIAKELKKDRRNLPSCLRPLLANHEIYHQALIAAVHGDVEHEDETERKLRKDTSTNPLLVATFRSLGYVVSGNRVRSFEPSSSSNSTITLDVVLSGGTESPLGFAYPTVTVQDRCSTNDIKKLQQQFELLARPFQQCSAFYDQHGLRLLDYNDCRGTVSHLNSVCIGMQNNPDHFWKISVLFDRNLKTAPFY